MSRKHRRLSQFAPSEAHPANLYIALYGLKVIYSRISHLNDGELMTVLICPSEIFGAIDDETSVFDFSEDSENGELQLLRFFRR